MKNFLDKGLRQGKIAETKHKPQRGVGCLLLLMLSLKICVWGDYLTFLSRSGQSRAKVSEVFTDGGGKKFLRVKGERNPGVYYGKNKFVCGMREVAAEEKASKYDVKPTVEKIRSMAEVFTRSGEEIKSLADRMEKTGDLTYASEVVNTALSTLLNARLDLMVTRPLREAMK